jgi:glycerol-1-phosphate dehydrogenase [NAD(P)+]
LDTGKMRQLIDKCCCGHHNESFIDPIIIEKGALLQAASYCSEQGFKKVMLIADSNTYRIAGQGLEKALREKEVEVAACLIQPNEAGDVVADERSIVQMILEMPGDAQALLAVGSGTIHDIVRFVSFKTKVPFISIPTAASVDGFASVGAPLIIRGFKQTIPASAPQAIFADTEVLVQAPRALTAAGFADMLGKFTALADWQVSRLIANEPYCEAAAEITRKALESSIFEQIAEGSEAGIHALMAALIESGLSMMLIGHSRPASGAEHHLSHYWEMEFLKQGKGQVFHGTKVGIASIIIAELYKKLSKLDLSDMEYGDRIQAIYAELPDPELLRQALAKVGGATRPAEVDIDEQLVRDALNGAHQLRDRHTGLWFIHEHRLMGNDGIL